MLGQLQRRWANIETPLGKCPVFVGLRKIVSLLAHRIGFPPKITALSGRCIMEVPAYLDLTPTVRHLPVVPFPSPPLLRYCAARHMVPLRCYNLERNVVGLGLGYIIESDHRA